LRQKHGKGTPFNLQNNINGIDGDPNKNGKGLQIYTLANKDVTTLQEAYVRKVIDTVNELDNVLYEISNENYPPSTEWQYYIIRYIKDYEKNKPQQHPVGMTFQYHGGKNQTLFESPADWISPNPEGGYRDDPPASDGKKVILNDTDHLWGIGGNQHSGYGKASCEATTQSLWTPTVASSSANASTPGGTQSEKVWAIP
jgi:hypothetical protein